MIKFCFTLLTLGLSMTSFAQSSAMTAYQNVEARILAFASAADRQDAEALDAILEDNFHLVMNQLFGGTTVMTMDKATYLDKIRKKEFGGEKRTVTIHSVAIYGKNAQAQATFKGSEMTFTSYLQLVQTADGSWKIIHDLPTVE